MVGPKQMELPLCSSIFPLFIRFSGIRCWGGLKRSESGNSPWGWQTLNAQRGGGRVWGRGLPPGSSLRKAALMVAFLGHAEPQRSREAWPHPGPARTRSADSEPGFQGALDTNRGPGFRTRPRQLLQRFWNLPSPAAESSPSRV